MDYEPSMMVIPGQLGGEQCTNQNRLLGKQHWRPDLHRDYINYPTRVSVLFIIMQHDIGWVSVI